MPSRPLEQKAKAVLERLMQKAEQAEVCQVRSEATKICFEANRLKSFEVKETHGIAARVIANGRLGFAASCDLEATDKLIANVLESACHGDAASFHFPPPQPGSNVQVYDPELAALPIERLVETGQEILAIILEAEHQAHVNVDLTRRVRQTTLRNSAGAESIVEKSTLSVKVTAERVQGDDVVVIGGHFGAAVMNQRYRALARRLARNLCLARRAATLTSGRMPVLFSPSGSLALALNVIVGLNGKNVYCGISPMAGRLGEQLFDEKLTLVDDPTLDGRPGSSPHDDEGLPRQRRVLIDRGVPRSFIYDLKTAAQAGVEPTGHGERTLFAPPFPAFSNLIWQEGDTPLTEILAGIERGLLVEMPLGVGQSNAIGGDFANTLGLAFKIESGEIVGRVKDVSIAGNVYHDLRHIAALSREAEWSRYDIRLPYILLPELNVIGGERR